MKKTMLILLSALLLMVSMVSAYLGEELVTCWSFTCDTDWVGFTVASGNWSYSDIFDYATYTIPFLGVGTTNNLSQSINIEAGKTYNVTIDILITKGTDNIDLEFYLGGTKQLVGDDDLNGVFSYEITTVNTDGIFLEGYDDGFTSNLVVRSISVKEVIEPPFGMIHQLKKPKGDTNKGMIVQLKRDESAIANGIIGMIVQLKRLLRI